MNHSILSVTTQAPDLTLLEIDELREAAEVVGTAQDKNLRRFGLRVAARIAASCRIRRGGAFPATLREESLLETFRRNLFGGVYDQPLGGHSDIWAGGRLKLRLRLSRRPIVSLDSLTFDGNPQDVSAATILVDSVGGFIEYLPGKGAFYGMAVAVSYTAGFATVPEDLKLAARMLLQQYLATDAQEPGLKQINVPNILERQYFQSPVDKDIPQNILDILAPYRNED